MGNSNFFGHPNTHKSKFFLQNWQRRKMVKNQLYRKSSLIRPLLFLKVLGGWLL